MPVEYGPRVVTDGLVLALDAADINSFDEYENRMSYSEDFSQWTVANVTRSYNTQISPDGTLTADEMYATSSAVNNGYISRAPNTSSFTQNTWHTFSVFWKPGTSSGLVIQIPWNDGANAGVIASFRLISGTVSPPSLSGYGNYQAAPTPTTATQYSNGWWRLSVSFRPTTAPVFGATVWLYPSVNSSGNRDVSLTSYLWGAQFESGSTMTNYYATTGTAKTRGSTWIDLTGSGNNGTLTNGPTYNIDNGGSLVFDGTNDYIINSSTTSLPTGNSSRTIQFWVYPKGDTNSIIQLGTGGGGNQIYLVQYYNLSGTVYLFTDGVNGGNNLSISGTQLPTLNAWNHITFGNSGQNWFYYLNGVSQASGTWGTTINTIGQKYIIAKRDDYLPAPGNVYGNIAQVSIYNRALTATEVQQNFNALRGRFGI